MPKAARVFNTPPKPPSEFLTLVDHLQSRPPSGALRTMAWRRLWSTSTTPRCSMAAPLRSSRPLAASW